MADGFSVVKVGGSLFDLPDLARRLRAILPLRSLLVPGGGPTADAVRDWDRRHGLGEEKAHWLALRSLTVNAFFLAGIIPGARVIQNFHGRDDWFGSGAVPILDMHVFALADEGRPGCLPHGWQVTSDSLAVRAAVQLGARKIIMLKSVDKPDELDWRQVSQQGYVDAYFPEVIKQMSPGLEFCWINLLKSP